MKNLDNCDGQYNNFAISCENVLDKTAPWKKKYERGNHSPFMNKTLSKVIMVRTKLKNTFLKIEARKIWKATICNEIIVSLLQKNIRDYFNNLNEKNICDNRKFCKVANPLLSNKTVFIEKITLVEGEIIIKTDQASVE